jgi:formamidopyrimidine-DNA glycosylase
MPELPEVETTRRGIAPHIIGRQIKQVIVRQPRLRWPVPARLKTTLPGQTVQDVTRRGKYLLLHTKAGTVILHLGMSGSLRLVASDEPVGKHDHVDIVFNHGRSLRLRDPRRFGAVLWTTRSPLQHTLIKSLGPEPLGADFDADHLYQRSRHRRLAIKSLIMDSKIVVGVGNIYANEALFAAGIRPDRAAGRISKVRYQRLVGAIKQVLTAAIAAGGTTLRDFTNGEGKPGYFGQKLCVYGRAGEPCVRCAKKGSMKDGANIGAKIQLTRQGQRATYFCRHCQR